MATLVAVLVGLSSLGQFAHFLLVPHAICAEHGELLELDEEASHEEASHEEASHAAPSTGESAHASSELAAEHDHCQLLARGQREQAEPAPPAVVVLPAAGVAAALPVLSSAALFKAIPALSLAPKTSPPPALVG